MPAELDLYRVELATVVSPYIGETEKNLGRVFDAVGAGTAPLLFEEADALFGQRSDVQHGHDRYANLATSFLLQRLEEFAGLAILATHRRRNLDPAFIRRLHHVVEFPLPDAAQRYRLWEGAFPAGIDCRVLGAGRHLAAGRD